MRIANIFDCTGIPVELLWYCINVLTPYIMIIAYNLYRTFCRSKEFIPQNVSWQHSQKQEIWVFGSFFLISFIIIATYI